MLPSLTALGHQAMCAAVLLSLQTVQSGRGWEVLWCLLRGHFLYFWSYPEEVEQSKVGPACDVQCDGVTAINVAMHQDFGPLSSLTEQYQC